MREADEGGTPDPEQPRLREVAASSAPTASQVVRMPGVIADVSVIFVIIPIG
jgi:hypothetical protein